MAERGRANRIMTGQDFSMAMVRAEANYSDVSSFVLSERRTGHRWEQDGPSNPMARCLQLMHCLGITLADAEWLISKGVAKAGSGPIPKPVINLGEQIAQMRAAEGSHRHDEDQGKRAGDRPAQRETGKGRQAAALV